MNQQDIINSIHGDLEDYLEENHLSENLLIMKNSLIIIKNFLKNSPDFSSITNFNLNHINSLYLSHDYTNDSESVFYQISSIINEFFKRSHPQIQSLEIDLAIDLNNFKNNLNGDYFKLLRDFLESAVHQKSLKKLSIQIDSFNFFTVTDSVYPSLKENKSLVNNWAVLKGVIQRLYQLEELEIHFSPIITQRVSQENIIDQDLREEALSTLLNIISNDWSSNKKLKKMFFDFSYNRHQENDIFKFNNSGEIEKLSRAIQENLKTVDDLTLNVDSIIHSRKHDEFFSSIKSQELSSLKIINESISMKILIISLLIIPK